MATADGITVQACSGIGQLQELYIRLAKASSQLNDQDYVLLGKACEVLKAHLSAKCLGLVASAKKQALLYSYSADGTPLVLVVGYHTTLEDRAVIRRGKQLVDLLLQRGYFKTTSTSGNDQIALLLAEPLSLSIGKGTWNVFAASCKLFPMIRGLGHEGIILCHVAADRALEGSLQRVVHQRNEAFYEEGVGPELGEDRGILHLLQWFVHTACGSHDCHKALQWGGAQCASPEVISDHHIIIESLRNSLSILHGHLRPFLMANMVCDRVLDDLEGSCNSGKCWAWGQTCSTPFLKLILFSNLVDCM